MTCISHTFSSSHDDTDITHENRKDYEGEDSHHLLKSQKNLLLHVMMEKRIFFCKMYLGTKVDCFFVVFSLCFVFCESF